MPPDKTLTPSRVTVKNAEQELTIDWADDHVSTYSLDGLRRACPCAGCQGGHDQMGKIPDPEIFLVPPLMRWESLKLHPVGNYAIRFVWDDGHDSGIYSWERLRRICPCPSCIEYWRHHS